jgi:hypothetical protein
MKVLSKVEIDQWEETEVTYYAKHEVDIEVKGKVMTLLVTVVDACYVDHIELKSKKDRKRFEENETKIRQILDNMDFEADLEDEEE